MSVGFETLKARREKIYREKANVVKERRSLSPKNSLLSLLQLVCITLFILSISYFPKSLRQITTFKINFQDSETTAPLGWMADYGKAYSYKSPGDQGVICVYGWIRKSDKKPVDISKNGYRTYSNSDILLNTFMVIQGHDTKDLSGNSEDALWEAQIPNGIYDVTVTAGDETRTDSRHCINVEGVKAIADFVPTSKVRIKSATVTVSVADGNLTIDATGGINTKINSVTIYRSVTKRPYVASVNPENGSVHISDNTSLFINVSNLIHTTLDNATINSNNVYLIEEATGVLSPSNVSGTGGGDSIAVSPLSPLKLNTTYRLTVSTRVKSTAGLPFIRYSSIFTTGSVSAKNIITAAFDKIPLANTKGQHTSLTIGPDGKLYALTIDGIIKRFLINQDGTLSGPELLYSLQDSQGARQPTLAIGLAFDPSSTATNLVAWVTHCKTFVLLNGPDWDGKLTRLSGPNLEKAQDALINLPRSSKDHLTNSIAFGPDGALYFNQGSNSAMGRADDTWGKRDEDLLSGAVLRLDVSKLKKLPLDVKTADGGGNYNPYSPNAPLTIYASGLRNGYDLLWHSNGSLYVPANGSDMGGNTPKSENGTLRPDGSVYNGPSIEKLSRVQQREKDLLFRIEKGGYYGHPNPERGEYVMNGGNPTIGVDSAEITFYPFGTRPDKNWRGYSFDFHNRASPDGVIEYKSNTFNGALKGQLLIVRYSLYDDIITLTPGVNKDIISATEGYAIKGFSGFVDPLDLTEDTKNGNIYVSEFGGEGKITLLQPVKETAAVARNKKP